ncbi:hypothetical protein [Puniceibacterium sediminis]|uniref:Uncharacterized protein n=1 Tax=Puniceibacterium sediminis TaxID=1608407 RepID=A0A238V0Q6_9RHOB|nr:hypothetical protein [Puniceibacterium sediminis]SNR27123.1 hypothetical protein SAMN06265370_101334 [Puniceibacterium sediminis]
MKLTFMTIYQATLLALLMVIGAYASSDNPKGCPSLHAEAQCEL